MVLKSCKKYNYCLLWWQFTCKIKLFILLIGTDRQVWVKCRPKSDITFAASDQGQYCLPLIQQFLTFQQVLKWSCSNFRRSMWPNIFGKYDRMLLGSNLQPPDHQLDMQPNEPPWTSLFARLTGNQVAVWTPCRVDNILLWRLIMKYFLWSLATFHRFKKGSCQFLVFNCLED